MRVIGVGLKCGIHFGVQVEWMSKRQSQYKHDSNERTPAMVWSGQESFCVNSQNITERWKGCFGKTLCIMRVWNAFYRVSSPTLNEVEIVAENLI
jgi:hypothetical protein